MGGMNASLNQLASRRDFIKTTGQIAAASALAGVALPYVHAAEDNIIHLALIGCGGRGSGAVANAMSAGGLVLGDDAGTKRAAGTGAGGPIQLIAMADLRPDRLTQSHRALSEALGERINVPPERRFLGFDAYRHAIDCLRPGDVAMLTTHAAFRAPHLEYAVEKGVNVFMEKDFAADPAGIKRILRAGEAAEKKNLKIAAGLMARHSSARQALIQKIRDGAMGEVQLIRAYRMDPGYFMAPFARGENELLWQLSPGHPYQFLWSSGGIFIELMIHQIDECFWIKDSWPVSAHGVGGRFAGSTDASQNLDSYSIEYTFADGTKALGDRPLHPQMPHRFCHVHPRDKVRGEILGGHSCADLLALQGSAHRAVQPRVASAEGNRQSLAGRMGRALECDPKQPAPQRGSASGAFEPRCHHGPGRCPHRQDCHVGRSDGVEFPVLLECGQPDGFQPGPGAGECRGSLPRAGAGGMDRNMRRGVGRPYAGCAFRSLRRDSARCWRQ
jgi:predicted dehydrogenase